MQTKTDTEEKTGKPILDALINASESFADLTATAAPEAPEMEASKGSANWHDTDSAVAIMRFWETCAKLQVPLDKFTAN